MWDGLGAMVGLPETRPEDFIPDSMLDAALRAVWSMGIKPPQFIIVHRRYARMARRTLRPPRQQFGGSGIRAIKRRAVRRPW